jgi:hypothetical protein
MAAVEYLLQLQGESGLFGGDRGDTAWAILALLDAGFVLPGDRRIDPAVRRAVDALLETQDTSGWIGTKGDLAGQVVATWAVAAAVSHLGGHERRESLEWALDVVLRAVERGAWRDERAPALDTSVSAAWTAAALHEARPLPGAPVEAIDEALDTLAKELPRSRLVGAPVEEYAQALVLRAAGDDPGLRMDALPPGRGGPVALLLGTTYHFHDPAGAGFEEWERLALGPAIARQRRTGPDAGSWDPSGDASRVRATALHVLAALVPYVPYVPPRK